VPFAVITRDAARAKPYAAALAPLGLRAIPMPVTEARPPRDPDALVRALRQPHAHALVTSARAARALIAAGRAAGVSLPAVWSVGDATAAAIAGAGWPVITVERDGADGASLARAIAARTSLAGTRILWPRAADARLDAADILRAAGAIVDDVIAYEMIPIAPTSPALAPGLAALRDGTAAVCAVFAPSQVHALAALIELPAVAAAFVAIGPSTAAALASRGIAPAIARSASPEAMAEAAASVYPKQR
jgi:uroporphyrinogen-III synthase